MPQRSPSGSRCESERRQRAPRPVHLWYTLVATLPDVIASGNSVGGRSHREGFAMPHIIDWWKNEIIAIAGTTHGQWDSSARTPFRPCRTDLPPWERREEALAYALAALVRECRMLAPPSAEEWEALVESGPSLVPTLAHLRGFTRHAPVGPPEQFHCVDCGDSNPYSRYVPSNETLCTDCAYGRSDKARRRQQ